MGQQRIICALPYMNFLTIEINSESSNYVSKTLSLDNDFHNMVLVLIMLTLNQKRFPTSISYWNSKQCSGYLEPQNVLKLLLCYLREEPTIHLPNLLNFVFYKTQEAYIPWQGTTLWFKILFIPSLSYTDIILYTTLWCIQKLLALVQKGKVRS